MAETGYWVLAQQAKKEAEAKKKSQQQQKQQNAEAAKQFAKTKTTRDKDGFVQVPLDSPKDQTPPTKSWSEWIADAPKTAINNVAFAIESAVSAISNKVQSWRTRTPSQYTLHHDAKSVSSTADSGWKVTLKSAWNAVTSWFPSTAKNQGYTKLNEVNPEQSTRFDADTDSEVSNYDEDTDDENEADQRIADSVEEYSEEDKFNGVASAGLVSSGEWTDHTPTSSSDESDDDDNIEYDDFVNDATTFRR